MVVLANNTANLHNQYSHLQILRTQREQRKKMVIKSIIKDLKGDYRFLCDLVRGKAEIRKIDRDEWKTLKPMSILRENGLWYVIIILALLMGYALSARVHESKCEQFIYENYVLPEMHKFGVVSTDTLAATLYDFDKRSQQLLNQTPPTPQLLGS